MQPEATPGSRGKITAMDGWGGPLIPIGTLAKRTRCNTDTIRFYEKIGMLPKPARTGGGHRVYAQAHAERLAFIRRSRELGFTLDEVRALLKLADTQDVPCADAKEVAAVHLASVRSKIADLRGMQKILGALIAQCDAGDHAGCPLIKTLLGR